MARQSQKSSETERLLRPDEYYFKMRKDLDNLIREVMIPEILLDYGFEKEGIELLGDIKILPNRNYGWIYNKAKDNGGLLGMYFNTYLRNELKAARDKWSLEQYEEASKLVYSLDKYIREVLDSN